MSRIYQWALLALLTLSLGACHTTKPSVRTQPPDADKPTEQPVPKREYTVVQFEAAVEGMLVNGQLRMAEDSVIWISVNKYIEVGRALATTDSLFLHAPLLNREEATDYESLQRRTGIKTTLADLQQMVVDPDAESRMADIARRLGSDAKIHIVSIRKVDQLTFPYTKPTQQ